MVQNGLPASELGLSQKDLQKEAKKAAKKKKASKKEVKGFYYYASEYQREKQKQRNPVSKIFHSVVEPLAIHGRAADLWLASKRFGGGGSAVLSTEFTNKALTVGSRGLTDADIVKFRATSQVHGIFEKAKLAPEQQTAAKSVLTDLFNKQGTVTPQDIASYAAQTGMNSREVQRLAGIVQENSDAFLTTDEMKAKFSDGALFGSLTQDQQEMARKLAIAARLNTIYTLLNYGKTAAIVTFVASNPAGWAAAGLTLFSAGFSGLTRASRLAIEGHTFDISKSKGIDISGETPGLLGKVFSVDWEKDESTRVAQILRASVAGGVVALGAKFAPQLLELGHEGAQVVAGEWHTILHDASQAATAYPDTFVATGAASNATSIALEHHHEVVQTALHEHLGNYAQEVKQQYLPDTSHHDWQQLHSFAREQHVRLPDGKTVDVNEIRLSYNGVDDGIPHSQHYIDLMMPDGKQVFLQNDAVLAVNGPDADKLINVYGLVNDHGHMVVEKIGEMRSINVAHQLGLDQARIDNFAHLSQEAHQHLWHGTQDASDLQTILHQRGLYSNGDNGNYLYAVRIGGGHFDHNGVFQIGASNHYYNHQLFNNEVIRTYQQTPEAIAKTVPDVPYHSVVAPELHAVDNGEDWVLSLFQNTPIHGALQTIDNITDFGLNNTDTDMLALENAIRSHAWAYATFAVVPYVAAGFAGYSYKDLSMNGSVNRLGKMGAGAIEVTLLYALPGAAIAAGTGWLIRRLRGNQASKPTMPQQTQSPSGGPSTPLAPSGAVESPTPPEAVQATVAGAPGQNSASVQTPAPAPTMPTNVAHGSSTTPTNDNTQATAQGAAASPASGITPPASAAVEVPVEAAALPEETLNHAAEAVANMTGTSFAPPPPSTESLNQTVATEKLGEPVPGSQLVTDFAHVGTFTPADLESAAYDLPEIQKEKIREELPKIELERPVEHWLSVTDELRQEVVHDMPFFTQHEEVVPLVHWFSNKENHKFDQNPVINNGEQIFPGQQNFFTGVAALMGAGIVDEKERSETQASAALALGDAIVGVYDGHNHLLEQFLNTQFTDIDSHDLYLQHDFGRTTGVNIIDEKSLQEAANRVRLDEHGQIIPTNGPESTLFVLSATNDGRLQIDRTATLQKIEAKLPQVRQRLWAGYLMPNDAMVIEFLGNGLSVTKLAEHLAAANK